MNIRFETSVPKLAKGTCFLLCFQNCVDLCNDRYIPGKNSKSNNKLDLVNTFFGVTYKSFY